MEWKRTLELADLQNYSDQVTLKDLISESEQLASEEHCVICRIEVNDYLLSEKDEQRLGDSPIRQVQKFCAVGAKRELVLQDAMKSIHPAIEALERNVLSIADSIRSQGFTVNIFNEILRLISDLEFVQNFFQRTLQSGDGSEAQSDEVFEKTLKDVLQAFERRDSVLLADLFEYELTKCFQNWHDRVQRESTKNFDPLAR